MRNQRGTPLIGVIVSVAFIVAGYFVGIHLGIPILEKAKQTAKWPSVEGKIESSDVTQRQDTSSDDRGGILYSADVGYSYAVKGQTYRSSAIRPGASRSSSSSTEQHRIIDGYPPGKVVPVYYDPEHPEAAVLEPGADWTNYILVIVGCLFLSLGVLTLLTSLRATMRRLTGVG